MKNLCITLHLKVPLIPGKYPLNLDGLLYWAAYEGSNEDDDAAQAILLKALAQEQGVFKASDMIYLQTPEVAITQKEAVFSTSMNWKEFKYPTNRTAIMELGGPYRARLTTYASIDVVAVRFYAKGDAELIGYLIETAGFIGRGNNQGHGEISEIVIEEVDSDLSWYRINGSNTVELHRCLPATVVDSINEIKEDFELLALSSIRVKPPYTTSPNVLGYSTAFRREVLTII